MVVLFNLHIFSAAIFHKFGFLSIAYKIGHIYLNSSKKVYIIYITKQIYFFMVELINI